MTKDDVINTMQGKMNPWQLVRIYCIDLGHSEERVQQLITALQQCMDIVFIHSLLQYIIIVSQINFEVTTLHDKNNQIIKIF